MDAIDALKHIQQMVLADRTKQGCPCCGKYKFSADSSNVMGNCLDCGYTVMNNRGTIERLKGQGVFALSRGAKGGIFSIVEGGWKPQLKHYLKLLQMLLVVQLMNLIIVFFILLKMIK